MRSLVQFRYHAVPALSFSCPVFNSVAHSRPHRRAAVKASAALADTITSTQNEYVKHCVKLRTSRKYRLECNSALLCGLVVLEELLKASAGSVKARYLPDRSEARLMPAEHAHACQEERADAIVVHARRCGHHLKSPTPGSS